MESPQKVRTNGGVQEQPRLEAVGLSTYGMVKLKATKYTLCGLVFGMQEMKHHSQSVYSTKKTMMRKLNSLK